MKYRFSSALISLFSPSLLVFSLLGLAGTAQAESPFKPSISGEVFVEWQDELTYDSDDKESELNNMFGRMEIAPKIGITDEVFVDGVIVTEPFDQAGFKNPGDDRYFESEGIFIEEIKLNYEHGPYAVWAGKFNPAFGIAWDYGRGIWSEDFAEDYEVTEKLGFGASYTYETEELGTHTFAANSFYNDTSFLGGSTLTRRDRASISDGGAGNTEDFSSYVFSLSGENVGNIENLRYSLGYRHLDQGKNDVGLEFDDEQGYVAMIGYIFPVNEDLKLDTLAEYVDIDNFGGIASSDTQYLTGSVKAIYLECWNVTLSYTSRTIDNIGSEEDFDDHLFQASIGYDFGNGFTAETGYRGSQESNIDANAVGFLVRYTKEF